MLLAHCLDKNRSYLFTWPDKTLSNKQTECFDALIIQRMDDYPVAYLLGTRAFWTLDLIVTPDVLIPRPETELLVEVALDKIKDIKNPKILDLGTGTGAIALALASERPGANIIASDYSEEALDIARQNTQKYKLEKQVTLIQSDWFSNIPAETFDLILSNPPYIAPNDPHLNQTIRHEPKQALVAENHGMNDIEILIKSAGSYLKIGAWIIIEHGYDQGEKTREVFIKHGFEDSYTRKDLNNNSRVTLAKQT